MKSADSSSCSHSFALPAWGSFHCSLGPRADERTPFQIGHHTNMGFYQLLDLHPVEKAAFHRVMEHLAATVPSWLDQIAFDQEFAQTSPSTPDTILFVDIGGGIGHQCTTIAKKYPNLIGRIILEDQPQVLALSVVAERIEKIPYDYLTVQPIQGKIAPIC
jgi:demethylsterigmatocystin 6-O-methyltransferase